MTRTVPSRVCSSWLVTLAISCGNQSIELSAPAKIEPSTDPTTLGSINEQVGWLTVDAERLYWTGTVAWPEPVIRSSQTGTALHSCMKDHCSDSLVTYDPSNVDVVSGFGVHDGQIYWRTVTLEPENRTTSIVTCPATGCVGPRRVLLAEGQNSGPIALGADAAYVSSWQGFIRIPYAGAERPTLVGSNIGFVYASAVTGAFLYWLAPEATGGRSALYRTRTDGSSEVETLAGQLKLLVSGLEQNSAAINFLSLAFDESYVYWTENTLTGSLLRCPLAGCAGSPEVIAAPIRAPRNLLPDGDRAYFQYDDTLLGNSLSSCILARCEPSAPVAQGLDGWNAIAIDDRYVYAATTEQLPNPDQPWDTPAAHIRRFPK